jgi:hypothetical protein
MHLNVYICFGKIEELQQIVLYYNCTSCILFEHYNLMIRLDRLRQSNPYGNLTENMHRFLMCHSNSCMLIARLWLEQNIQTTYIASSFYQKVV